MDGLGPGAHLLLQRRLPADARASSTPGRSAGRPREVWAEIWHDIGPRIETRAARPARRPGTKACCCSSSAAATPRRPTTPSPTARCADDDGARRRHALRRHRGDRAGHRRAPAGARCATSRPSSPAAKHRAEVLRAPSSAASAPTRRDLPFALIYLFDGRRRRRGSPARRGIARRPPGGAGRRSTWPTAARPGRRGGAGRTGAPVTVDDLGRRFGQPAGRRLGQSRRRRRSWCPIAQPGPGRARPGFLVAGAQPVPAARRRLPRLPRAGRRPDRRRPRQRAGLRGGAPARRGAGRARPRQDRVLLQRQPRVPHAADADARARSRTLLGRAEARSPPASASAARSCIATACGC